MTVPLFVTTNGATAGPTGRSNLRVVARGQWGDPSGQLTPFAGAYALQRFVRQYGQLAAAGVVGGRLCAASGEEICVTSRRVTVAVTAAVTESGVLVEVGPLDVNLSGLMTRLEPVTVHLVPHPGWGQLCPALLRAISPALARPITGERVVALLNALPTLLDPPEPAPAAQPDR